MSTRSQPVKTLSGAFRQIHIFLTVSLLGMSHGCFSRVLIQKSKDRVESKRNTGAQGALLMKVKD
jgi:hypothetical protein